MSPNTKLQAPQRPSYPEPAPADYCDEVSETTLLSIKESVEEEFAGEQFEIISGPAW